MTDRELLELAAKAAGFEFKPSRLKPNTFVIKTHEHEFTRWNPLTDDGDALRLAVQLKLDISFGNKYYFDEGPMTFCGQYWDCNESQRFKRFTKHKGDPYAATRRAIVRAAAEIGKAMP